MKKLFVSILAIALLCSTIPTAAFAATNDFDVAIMPYASAIYVDNTITIVNGVANIELLCSSGTSATTYIQATSYIEKLVGGSYVRVPLENGQTEWTNTVSGNVMSVTVNQKIMTGTGQYRLTTQYVIHNSSTGNQVKTATHIANYS